MKLGPGETKHIGGNLRSASTFTFYCGGKVNQTSQQLFVRNKAHGKQLNRIGEPLYVCTDI